VAEAEININISDKEIEKLVHVALMDKLTPETRDKLIADAIHVLLHEKTRYGDGESNLQAVFYRAVNSYVTKYVDKLLEENTEFTGQLEDIATEAFKRFFSNAEQREKVVERVSGAIYKAFGERY